MLKRDDIKKADRLNSELSNLETGLSYWQHLHTIEVSGRDGIFRIELGDYPEPSELGRAFTAVQAAIVGYYQGQVSTLRNELAQIGVNVG